MLFRRTTFVRNALLASILSCALVAGFASPGSADSKRDLEQQRRSVAGDLGDAQKSYDQSSKEYEAAAAKLKKAQTSLDSAEAELGQTQGQLTVAQAKDEQMQAELDKSEAQLAKAKAELRAGRKELAKSESEVEAFTVESLQDGDRGLRAFGELLRGASPSEFSEQMSANESVSDAQIATMERLAATKVMLELNREKVQQLRDEVKAQREAAAANLVEKKALQEAAAAQAASVSELVDKRASARGKASKIFAADQAKVRALEQERASLTSRLKALAAREAAAAAKRKNSNKGGSSSSSGGSSSNGDSGGTLSRPVGGYITSPYAMRVHPVTGVYKLHDGTDFGSPCGTPIRAAAGGTVISRYYNAGYGNRVLINHGMKRGVNVVTTYNHLSRFAVGSGQRVKRGQVIGYVGSTGYSTGCHLHFMVLSNGNTTNPMGWL